jgi:hypothetical protein
VDALGAALAAMRTEQEQERDTRRRRGAREGTCADGFEGGEDPVEEVDEGEGEVNLGHRVLDFRP